MEDGGVEKEVFGIGWKRWMVGKELKCLAGEWWKTAWKGGV